MVSPIIDLEKEAILYEGSFCTRDDLAQRIRQLLDAGSYDIVRPSTALDQLNQALSSVRTIAFRATSDLVEAVNLAANSQGKSMAQWLRELITNHLVHGAETWIPVPGPSVPAFLSNGSVPANAPVVNGVLVELPRKRHEG